MGTRSRTIAENPFRVGVKDAFLLQVVRHGVLREKWCLQTDFGPNPFAFGVRCIGRVIAASAAAELGTEIGRSGFDRTGWISRQAASPTVPETSIFNFRTAMLNFLPETQTRRKVIEKSRFCPSQCLRASVVELTMREPLVQHEIDEDSGQRYIHPKGPCPSRDHAMLVITCTQSPVQRNDRERNDHDCERYM